MPTSDSDIQKLADEALQAALDDTEAGRFEEAEALFRGVLQLQPGRAEARFGLGFLDRRAGRAEDAIPHFTAALQAAPGEAAYWLACLDALMAARQFVSPAGDGPAGAGAGQRRSRPRNRAR